MDDSDRIEILERQLSRLLGWIADSESRTSFALGLATGMLGVLGFFKKDGNSPESPYALIAGFLLVGCVLSSFLSIFPRTSKGSMSLIYFGSIDRMRADQYAEKMKAVTFDRYASDLISSCYKCSKIAKAKYRWVKISLGCLALASLPWALALKQIGIE